jgi:voltage-gated potassium channel
MRNIMFSGFKNLRILLFLPLAVMVIGTLGFKFLENLSFFDAFYFTIATISTVGYGDIYPTSTASKIFCIVLIIIGLGLFLTIVTSITQILIQSGQNRIRSKNIKTIIGVFFTEVGDELLKLFTQFDPNVDKIRKECLVVQSCSETDFISLKKRLDGYEYFIDPSLMDLERLGELLRKNGDLLLRQIENPSLIEHESFTEVLWAVIHLRDELISTKSYSDLSKSDRVHLANDINRAYSSVAQCWVDHMHYLKESYPYLFSLAIRTNPFIVNPVSQIQ